MQNSEHDNGNGNEVRKGFTPDGYICDQEQLTDFPYRTVTTDYNGCGWIACYNLRRYLGHDVTPEEVNREMDEMHHLRFPGPTTMTVMRKYLDKYIGNYKEVHGREEAVRAAKQAKAGIFRYYEEGVPHFVAFARAGEGLYRFWNVNDNLWDFTDSLDHFAEQHFKNGAFIALTVPR